MSQPLIRVFDVVLSIIGLICLSPLLIPVMIILKLTGEREVFYLQERVGKDGKLFKLVKFVTMRKDSEKIGTGTVTVKNDPRILPFGRFLRKTKINELPQLFNVLKGDMSLVGPRPQTPRCFAAFPDSVKGYITRIKPGVSGVGSIVFRNEEELLDQASESTLRFYDEVIAPYKGELEKWLVENLSLSVYFKVILATILVVLFPKSRIYTLFFPNLPPPPPELKTII